MELYDWVVGGGKTAVRSDIWGRIGSNALRLADPGLIHIAEGSIIGTSYVFAKRSLLRSRQLLNLLRSTFARLFCQLLMVALFTFI